MQCAVEGCSAKADQQCAECSRNFCEKHVDTCELCNATVCFDCRDAHEASPLHEERFPNP
jgi:hypothetical protein